MSKRHMRSGSHPFRKLNLYCAVCDDVDGNCDHPRVRLGMYSTKLPSIKRKNRRTKWRRGIVERIRKWLFPKEPCLQKQPPRKRSGKIMPKHF